VDERYTLLFAQPPHRENKRHPFNSVPQLGDENLALLLFWATSQLLESRLRRINLFPGIAKTFAFRKPSGTGSSITSYTSLYNTHGLPGISYSATALQHKLHSLILRRER